GQFGCGRTQAVEGDAAIINRTLPAGGAAGATLFGLRRGLISLRLRRRLWRRFRARGFRLDCRLLAPSGIGALLGVGNFPTSLHLGPDLRRRLVVGAGAPAVLTIRCLGLGLDRLGEEFPALFAGEMPPVDVEGQRHHDLLGLSEATNTFTGRVSDGSAW